MLFFFQVFLLLAQTKGLTKITKSSSLNGHSCATFHMFARKHLAATGRRLLTSEQLTAQSLALSKLKTKCQGWARTERDSGIALRMWHVLQSKPSIIKPSMENKGPDVMNAMGMKLLDLATTATEQSNHSEPEIKFQILPEILEAFGFEKTSRLTQELAATVWDFDKGKVIEGVLEFMIQLPEPHGCELNDSKGNFDPLLASLVGDLNVDWGESDAGTKSLEVQKEIVKKFVRIFSDTLHNHAKTERRKGKGNYPIEMILESDDEQFGKLLFPRDVQVSKDLSRVSGILQIPIQVSLKHIKGANDHESLSDQRSFLREFVYEQIMTLLAENPSTAFNPLVGGKIEFRPTFLIHGIDPDSPREKRDLKYMYCDPTVFGECGPKYECVQLFDKTGKPEGNYRCIDEQKCNQDSMEDLAKKRSIPSPGKELGAVTACKEYAKDERDAINRAKDLGEENSEEILLLRSNELESMQQRCESLEHEQKERQKVIEDEERIAKEKEKRAIMDAKIDHVSKQIEEYEKQIKTIEKTKADYVEETQFEEMHIQSLLQKRDKVSKMSKVPENKAMVENISKEITDGIEIAKEHLNEANKNVAKTDENLDTMKDAIEKAKDQIERLKLGEEEVLQEIEQHQMEMKAVTDQLKDEEDKKLKEMKKKRKEERENHLKGIENMIGEAEEAKVRAELEKEEARQKEIERKRKEEEERRKKEMAEMQIAEAKENLFKALRLFYTRTFTTAFIVEEEPPANFQCKNSQYTLDLFYGSWKADQCDIDLFKGKALDKIVTDLIRRWKGAIGRWTIAMGGGVPKNKFCNENAVLPYTQFKDSPSAGSDFTLFLLPALKKARESVKKSRLKGFELYSKSDSCCRYRKGQFEKGMRCHTYCIESLQRSKLDAWLEEIDPIRDRGSSKKENSWDNFWCGDMPHDANHTETCLPISLIQLVDQLQGTRLFRNSGKRQVSQADDPNLCKIKNLDDNNQWRNVCLMLSYFRRSGGPGAWKPPKGGSPEKNLNLFWKVFHNDLSGTICARPAKSGEVQLLKKDNFVDREEGGKAFFKNLEQIEDQVHNKDIDYHYDFHAFVKWEKERDVKADDRKKKALMEALRIVMGGAIGEDSFEFETFPAPALNCVSASYEEDTNIEPPPLKCASLPAPNIKMDFYSQFVADVFWSLEILRQQLLRPCPWYESNSLDPRIDLLCLEESNLRNIQKFRNFFSAQNCFNSLVKTSVPANIKSICKPFESENEDIKKQCYCRELRVAVSPRLSELQSVEKKYYNKNDAPPTLGDMQLMPATYHLYQQWTSETMKCKAAHEKKFICIIKSITKQPNAAQDGVQMKPEITDVSQIGKATIEGSHPDVIWSGGDAVADWLMYG
eukprot:g5127.t1